MPDVYGTTTLHLPMWLLLPLATSELRLAIYGLRWLYGAFRFLHLVGMGGFFSFVLLIELKRLGFFPNAQIARQPMLSMMNWALGLTLVSGLALFLYDPIGVGLHTMFLPKLLLIVFAVVLAYGVPRVPVMKQGALRKATAAAALATWTLVVAASVWNNVERPLNPADVHRADPRVR